MPHLRFRGIEKQHVKEISKNLVDKLAKEVECPREWFTLEHIESLFIFDGEENKNKYPFVEVLWFDRGSAVMSNVANLITDMIKSYSYDCVTVIFTNLTKEHYYENGEHF